MIGAEPFQKIARVDNQCTYFMGASRAKQMLAVCMGEADTLRKLGLGPNHLTMVRTRG
jgi:hypothetical protein